MKAIIQRDKPKQTVFGKLYLPWLKVVPDIYTNEPLTCIPAGIYVCIAHNSPKHPDTWEVTNVPGHTDILIHPGNFASEVRIGEIIHHTDSLGCILPGFGIDEDVPMVTRSIDAMNYLRITIGIKSTWQLEIKE